MTADSVSTLLPVAPPQAAAPARPGWRKLLKRILFRADLGACVRRPLHALLRLRSLTRDELEANPIYHAKHFGSPEPVTVCEPMTDGNTPRNICQRFAPKSVEIPTPFVCTVPDVLLCGPRAVGFDGQGRVILETTPPVYHKQSHLYKNVSLRTLRDRFLKAGQVQEVDVAFSFVNGWEGNYWHWLVDSLTRLEGVEQYQRMTGIWPKLIVKANPNRTQLATLACMGYGESDLIRWKTDRLRVRKLIVSPFRRAWKNGEYDISSPRALRFVRDRFLANLPPTPAKVELSECVFISRRRTAARRIVNEDEVMAALAPLGFRSYLLEEMDLADQVRLFNNARVVVAPHGAGLTNQIFGRQLTIIELFGDVCPACFSGQASALGFKYCFMRSPVRPGDLRGLDADLVVNVPNLLALLDRAITS